MSGVLCSVSLYGMEDLIRTMNMMAFHLLLLQTAAGSPGKAENSTVFVPGISGLRLGLCPGGGLLPTCLILLPGMNPPPPSHALHLPCPVPLGWNIVGAGLLGSATEGQEQGCPMRVE